MHVLKKLIFENQQLLLIHYFIFSGFALMVVSFHKIMLSLILVHMRVKTFIFRNQQLLLMYFFLF
jgi:hypothetical protein